MSSDRIQTTKHPTIVEVLEVASPTTTGVSVVIDCLGGNCPVQAYGTIDGKSFYFRARGEHWSMSIGGADVIGQPEWYHEEEFGDGPYDAGWMSEGDVNKFIRKSADRFHAGHEGKTCD